MQPNVYCEDLTKLDLVHLEGRPYCIIDVDNTVALRHSHDVPLEVVAFLADLRERGILKQVCLVSNVFFGAKRRRRVEAIAQLLGASYVHARGRHSKPHRKPFEAAMNLMGSNPKNTVVIGDQLFTDIRGGNALGIYTILIKPLGSDAWFTQPKRWLERFFLTL